MVEIEDIDVHTPMARRRRFAWLLTLFIRPGKTMREIAGEEKAVWWLPMLILSILTIASVLVAGPLRKEAALNAQIETPESFQWMSPEQQEQYMQAQRSAAEPVRTHLFPGIGAITSLWLSWIILGSILHLVLTMLGSRSTNTTVYNIAAWASLPVAVRLVLQIVVMLSSKQLIGSPGVSGFVMEAEGFLGYTRSLLTMVDIYLVWQILLLWFGAASTSGLTRGKAFSGVLISAILLLLIAAVPGFLMAQVSGLNVSSPFFFF